MNKNSYIFNHDDRKMCSGCGACAQICSHGAIAMQEDSEGFLYPNVNTLKCVDCGLCDRICPEVNNHQENNDFQQSYYLATNIDKSFSKDCATIGVCSMLSQWIIGQQGICFGVMLNENNWKSEHICVINKLDIDKIKNSKYVQSDTKNTYKQTKQLLLDNRNVLYIGTPCQIAGLKAYLRKDYINLYTIDLICHGTYSYKLLQKEVLYWEKTLNGKVSNFRFRSKKQSPWSDGGIINFDLTNSKGKIVHIERPGICSPTYRAYAYSPDDVNYNLRESCYSCTFRSSKRYGDLTVGDAWGIDKYKKEVFTKNNKQTGISLVFCNTSKGEFLLRQIENQLILTNMLKYEVFVQSALLPCNRYIPSSRYELYNKINEKEYQVLLSEILDVDFSLVYKKYKRKKFKLKFKRFIKRFFER
ncbi:Coenzyme F420 hydrogenase/dehydrogenase, beta subunit C-terminal domain [uncultured Bacteroides sp.]|uniref:Coenzyme F420 hydrogenase/dehydrogenase, beta subunit C-terminal domain n=1 Tax=uncultured Bacteroides sp. TaxID=162156 RepID=UPI00260AC9B9|nr:Coenzyme F420 hydrogenase/dehydrogenase, beta subunit C-terminal domain [uncultured Bacteroides sp.]